jgi:hypothetical protein
MYVVENGHPAFGLSDETGERWNKPRTLEPVWPSRKNPHDGRTTVVHQDSLNQYLVFRRKGVAVGDQVDGSDGTWLANGLWQTSAALLYVTEKYVNDTYKASCFRGDWKEKLAPERILAPALHHDSGLASKAPGRGEETARKGRCARAGVYVYPQLKVVAIIMGATPENLPAPMTAGQGSGPVVPGAELATLPNGAPGTPGPGGDAAAESPEGHVPVTAIDEGGGAYITGKQACLLTGMSPTEITRICQPGGPVRYERQGRRLKLHARDLADYLEQRDTVDE